MHILHCERQNTQSFFEPLNSISNAAFLISAYYAHKYIKENKIQDKNIQKLPYVIGLMGIGSFMFHSFRNQITNYADVIPIYFFIVFSIFIALQKLIKKKSLVYSLIVTFGIVQLGIYFTLLNYLYGSINYIATLTTLLILAYAIYRKYGKVLLQPMIFFITIFGVALIFRNIDFIICPYFRIGTHYMWHILIALTTYLGVKFLVKLDKVS